VSSRRGGSRRKKRWGGAWVASDFTDFSGFATENDTIVTNFWARFPAGILSPDDENRVEDDFTLVRTLLAVESRVDLVSSPPSAQINMGVGLLTWDNVDDTTPDPTTVPNPTTNPDADWIARWVQPTTFLGLTGESRVQGTGFDGKARDFRSKRKLSRFTGLMLVWSITLLATASGNPLARWKTGIDARFLFLEP